MSFISTRKSINIDGARILVKRNNLYVEEKFDGSRFKVHHKSEGEWEFLSRIDKDRADNVPYIIKQLKTLNLPVGTMFDAELLPLDVPRKVRWELSRSAMGTKGYYPAAHRVHMLIFGIQQLGTVNYRQEKYMIRRRALLDLFENIQAVEEAQSDTFLRKDHIAIPRAWPIKYIDKLWTHIVDNNSGEGVMLKDSIIGDYGKDWIKVKKEFTFDVFIIGTTKGKGKYEGQVGTLEVAVFNDQGVIIPIGKVSTIGEDKDRLQLTEMALQNRLKMKVIEIVANEVTKNKKLRHARFLGRWRPDKPAFECKLHQLEEAL